eukprot:CAMPEP_0181106136 /NCGR_PEP_ID=MMETSP1071-20121207/16369_1 /TAXON_ID=35127 /ORGANISM="Thalassiosira sp., Strain NH16" /LENGTH=247 /DNA_ID=CAMNT_0023189519 /DNA_START=198 /DNA_END=941 /DNA_ORIENTATION=+
MTFQNKSHVASITALLLSSPIASAFSSITPTSTKSILDPRSAVIQRYRAEDTPDVSQQQQSQPKHQSDVFSFLPSRLSTIERMNRPSQFQEKVLDEKDSLVVVRFYAEVCPSCRATAPLFRKWSRGIEKSDMQSNISVDAGVWRPQQEALSVKILEMPLNMATSAFFKDELHVEQLPYYHVYHPEYGLVEEQLAMSKSEFEELTNNVDCWSKGGCDADFEGIDQSHWDKQEVIEFESQCDEDCEQFC